MVYDIKIEEARKLYPEYTFIRRLTASVQKAAFHVRDAQGKDLCLKLIAPNTPPERLDREILALETLNHPNIARLEHYLYESRNGVFRHHILEQYIEGSDLSDLMQGALPWDLDKAALFFLQIANSLEALAQHNVVHRDLKPTNIRVMPDGRPVLVDFGLARLLDHPDLTATSDGAAFGTPMYFSPEQWSGNKRDIDCRTDLFALGILMYEITTGEHPFLRTNMRLGDLRDAVCTSNDHLKMPAFLSLPPKWQVLISRLLQKQRVQRPQNAQHVSKMLVQIVSDSI